MKNTPVLSIQYTPILSPRNLQLISAAGLDDTVLFRGLGSLVGDALSDTLGTLPAKSLEALRKVRVGEVVAGIHPVGVHGAEVLNLELEQGAGEFLGVAELLGKGIGLELKLAADNVHEQVDDQVHGGKGVREEDEADDDGVLGEEAKVRVQRAVVDEDREQQEDVERVSLTVLVLIQIDEDVLFTWEIPNRLVV